eukprot:scaffold107886_cov63-Phaeocystis_antarctica.AAC.3
MASQLCQRLANNPALRADSDELGEQSIKYEDLAIELLDAVRESDDAVPLRGGGGRPALAAVHALRRAPPLPAHPWQVLQRRLPRLQGAHPAASSPLAIAAQALLPFAPGTVVEVMPVDLLIKPNVALRGKDVEKLHHTTIDDEMDPDLMNALDAIKKAASVGIPGGEERDRREHVA